MKFVLLLLAFCSVAQAQRPPAYPGRPGPERTLEQLSFEVYHLNKMYGERLPVSDEQYVRESLRYIKQIFAKNGFNGQVPPERPRNLICESSANKLIDLNNNSRVVHDFTSFENCNEARAFILKNEHYCDYNDNRLYTPQAQFVYDFSNAENCREGRAFVNRGMNFCDYNDNTLRDPSGKLIYDFSSAQDCKRALEGRN